MSEVKGFRAVYFLGVEGDAIPGIRDSGFSHILVGDHRSLNHVTTMAVFFFYQSGFDHPSFYMRPTFAGFRTKSCEAALDDQYRSEDSEEYAGEQCALSVFEM